MKTIAIIGTGDLGQQMGYYAVADGHYAKVVYFDDFATRSEINGHEIIGKTSEIDKAFADKKFDELIIGIGYSHLAKRKEFFEHFNGKIPFGQIIHSTCWIDPSVEVQPGCFFYPNVCVDYRAVIRANSCIANNTMIAHDSIVGSHTFVSASVAVAGFVEIGEQCFIGIASTLIDKIKIADKVQLGGATVVIKSIEQAGLYVGSPAKFIR